MNAVDTALTGKNAVKLISGNHACALGAIAAGCRFFAGYPITPSSEIAERLARRLPEVDGVFVQMEDEIASMAAVIGASMGGVKAMTATSGPGFSLKQENLGYAAGAEIPCVIVNVMRGGPSTGMPTRPSQADLMQARWGSHGDYPMIALTPASVAEIYSETIRAFDLAEQCRSPVVLLYDQVIAQLSETVALNPTANSNGMERKSASGPRAAYKPYDGGSDSIPAMARPGAGYRTHTTGLTHGEDGFPTQNPEAVTRNLSRLFSKLERHRDLIDSSETLHCDDADVVIVAIGISARAATGAVELCRAQGLRVGLFRPITFWPFPENALLPSRGRGVRRAGSRNEHRPAPACRRSRARRHTGRRHSSFQRRGDHAGRHCRARRGAREGAVMFIDSAASFEVRDYLRKEMMPHFLCPGCGHGIALRALLWAIHDLGIDKDKLAVVSGIGCAGRLSAYIDANTFHVTHGRPLAYATGLALARPDLHVVVITGDGDCLAIGGNHLIHACRRNLKLTCLMLNNEVYGMTGGQVSPTTSETRLTTTTPLGNQEPHFDACVLATAAGAGFVGREVTHHVPKLKELIKAGLEHPGFAFVEVLSDCTEIFGRKNDLGSSAEMVMRQKSNIRPSAYADTVDTPFRPNTLPTGVLTKNNRPEYGAAYRRAAAERAGNSR